MSRSRSPQSNAEGCGSGMAGRYSRPASVPRLTSTALWLPAASVNVRVTVVPGALVVRGLAGVPSSIHRFLLSNSCLALALNRTSKSERNNKIGCFLECRELPMYSSSPATPIAGPG